MGLEKLECKQCFTVFYGVLGRDIYCHICKTIIDFRKAFELEDVSVNEIDFKRIRNPQWMKGNTEDPKDWRNYIPLSLKEIWNTLPVESRALAIMFAEREARAIDIISDKIAAEVKKC